MGSEGVQWPIIGNEAKEKTGPLPCSHAAAALLPAVMVLVFLSLNQIFLGVQLTSSWLL